jgi:isopropylmalate/homocitrate/citramalate synthase
VKTWFPFAHFHDTRGTGLVNYVAAYEAGVRHFDSSFGGVGGHPAKVKYGGGHTGNVCTEDLVNLFESMGIATGIDLDGLARHGGALRAGARARAPRAGHAQRLEVPCSRA